jgi:hypothetical protein
VRSRLLVILCTLAALASSVPASAQVPPLPGGECPGAPGTDDRCEAWVAIYNDELANAKEFADDIALSPDDKTVYMAAHTTVGADLWSADSQWAISAYDSTTGQRRWLTKWGDPQLYSFPGGLEASPDGRFVYASGSTRNDFGDPDGHLATVAFDAITGQVAWEARYDGPGNGTDNARTMFISPDGGSVYVIVISSGSSNADLDYAFVAYDAATGAQRWALRWNGLGTGGEDSPFAAALSPAGDVLYASGHSAGAGEYDIDFGTVAVSTVTGQILWVARYGGVAPDRVYSMTVSPDGNVVYVAGESHNHPQPAPFPVDYSYAVVAYDAHTGAQLWEARKQWPQTTSNFPNGIAATNDAVVVTGQTSGNRQNDVGTVAFAPSDGHELWADRYGLPDHDFEFSKAITAGPDGTVYLTGISSDSRTAMLFANKAQIGDLLTIAYDSATGTRRWTSRYNTSGYDFDIGYDTLVSKDGSKLFTLSQLTHNVSLDNNFYNAAIVSYNL